MPKDKRSFFERITGSISVADDRNDFEYNQKSRKLGMKEEANWAPEEEPESELAVDVYQTPSDIIIQTMVAGVRPEDLNISITREMVTIKGSREKTANITEEDYFQKELFWGAFSRTILLPAEVETEEAEATEKQGLLTIRLPKIDKDRVQKLKVKTI